MTKLRTLTIAAISFLSVTSLAADLYVSSSGSDSNSGASSSPLKTIARASALATPGTTVHVLPGTYPGGFKTTTSGSATARIVYKSETKWGAKILANNAAVVWDNRGNYTDIVGFEVDGTGSTQTTYGLYVAGSYSSLQYNHVHHIATSATCTSNGGSAIGTDHYYYGVNNDVIGNVVHHIGTPTCAYIQGIYISTSGNVKNNLAYNIGAAAIHLWHDATSVNIVNNTVASSGVGIIVGGGDFYHSSNGMADNCNVINNISFDNQYGISEQGKTGPNNKYINNLVFKNSTMNWDLDSGKTHTGSIAADPLFVKYDRIGSGLDFHLQSGSPALNSGSSLLAPPRDINEVDRSLGGVIDRGAYEMVSTSTPAPAPAPAPAPILSLSTTSLVFPVTNVGQTSAIQVVTLKNTGTAALSFPAAFVLSSNFAFGGIGTCQVNVQYAPGASCTASVVFKPTTSGSFSGTLSIKSNASSLPQIVNLSGKTY
jgi:hypothetical protein